MKIYQEIIIIYDLQLQINAIISKGLLNEELLVYKTEVDLTDIKIEETKNSKTWIYIITGIIGGILLILAIVLSLISLNKLL